MDGIGTDHDNPQDTTPNAPCEWEIVDVGVTIEYWKSGCGVEHIYTSPNDNDFTYCPYCGNPLIVVYYEGD